MRCLARARFARALRWWKKTNIFLQTVDYRFYRLCPLGPFVSFSVSFMPCSTGSSLRAYSTLLPSGTNTSPEILNPYFVTGISDAEASGPLSLS